MARKRDTSGLRPFNKLPPDEAKKIRSKGAAAATAKKAKKKKMREELDMIMSSLLEDGSTVQCRITWAIVQRAMDGDTRAYEIIRDTLGEKPVDKAQTSVSGSISFKWSDTEQDA